MVCLFGMVLITFLGCNKAKPDAFSDFVEGYIVGSFQCPNQANRGYCIILKNNTDSVYSFSLPDNKFEFPVEILKPGFDSNTGGPFFLPDSLRRKFEIKFKFRKPVDIETIGCPMAFNTFGPTFSWKNWRQVIIDSINSPIN